MAGNKYLALDPTTSLPKEIAGLQASAGVGSAGSIPALNSSGVIDPTMMPPGVEVNAQSFPTSENLAASALVNIFSSSGTPTARNANATDATKPANGMVIASSVSPAANNVYFPGATITGLSGLTIGAPVFLSAGTSGAITSTAPSAAGNLVQQVGWALSATSIFFFPTPGIIHG